MLLDTLSEYWLWELLGRLHPLVVHFPIGILILAFFLELFTFGGKRLELRAGIRWMVYTGAGTAVIAAIVGLMLAYGGNYPETTVSNHRWTGIATVFLALLAAWLLFRAEKSSRNLDLTLYRIALGLSVLLLTVAGHYGASLTHGDDYITSVLPWNYETLSRGEPNALLTELIEHREIGPLEEPHLNKLNRGVRQIFAHSCYRCHSSDQDAEGGLLLDSREGVMAGGDGGPIIVPGEPDDSELIRRLLLPSSHDDVMPQRGRSLYAEEVELIRLWIELGAHWPDEDIGIFREAELALEKPDLPDVPSGFDHPVDRFTDIYFQEHGISWPEPVDDVRFIRRVYMDVIGLLPESEEVRAFVSDTSPDKRQELIDRLLDRDHDYTQHELSFWNDLLRNAYTGTGFITGGRKQITDWLYNALQKNKPYNQMVHELVNPTEESEGFIRGIQWRGDFNSSQSTEMQAAQNISQSLLGLNLKCASCHNSFVSNLTLDQAYSFAAVFSDTLLQVERCEVPTGDFAEPGFIYTELGDIDADLSRDERLSQLADIIVDESNGRLYRTIVNRYWANLMGRGLVEPTDEMDREPWSQDLLDWLAVDLIENDYDLRHLKSTILNSKTYQLPSVGVSETDAGTTDEFIFRGPLRKRLTAEQFSDALSQIAAPAYHSVAYDPYERNGAEADWIWYDSIVDDRRSLPEPGLYYFRYGFDLSTNEDIFDANLLISVDDAFQLYLNEEKIGEGSDWRKVERINVTDQLASADNILAVIGKNVDTVPNPAGLLLNLRITYSNGEVQEIHSNDGWKVMDSEPGSGWMEIDYDDTDWEQVRVYGNQSKSNYWGRLVDFTHDPVTERLRLVRASLVTRDPFQSSLGRPAREIVNTRRESEPTLLQALELTNGEFLNDVLARGAEEWVNTYGNNPNEMINRIYVSALSRTPSEREKEIANELLGPAPGSESVQDLLWAIVMQPEFQWVF
jgi:uncharacterized membrane protein